MSRITRSSLVVIILAAGMVLVPTPTLVWANEMTTTTETAELSPEPGPVQATPVEEVNLFVVIGVTLEREPTAPVAVRVRSEGLWQDWVELEVVADHGAEGVEADGARPGVTSEPYFVGAADAYELRAPDGVGEVEVHLVREESTLVPTFEGAVADGAPAINGRDAWGARAPKSDPQIADDVEFAVVHHSATPNTYTQEQVPAVLRSIQAFHMDANGWDDIGYNLIVDRFGRVWEGRSGGVDRAVVGAHAAGFNTGSTGVMVLGDFDSGIPTEVSVTAAERLIAWKFAYHRVDPTGTFVYRPGSATKFGAAGTPVELPRVVGHGDVGQTSCPGASLRTELADMRMAVVEATPTFQPEAPAHPLPGDFDGDGGDDVFLYRPGAPTDRALRGGRTSSGLLGLGGQSGPSLSVRAAQVRGIYRPVTGDFTGDGRADIFWYAPGVRADSLWAGRSDGGHDASTASVRGTYDPVVGDFDGDGTDDIIWHAAGQPVTPTWFGTSAGFDARSRTSAASRHPMVGDFDGDGRSDVFWYVPGAGVDEVWFGSSDRTFVRTTSPVQGSYEPFVGDFSGDGLTDIYWYRPGADPDTIWSGSRSRVFEARRLDVGGRYDPVVGDFDGNGRSDVLWSSEATAQDPLWLFGSDVTHTVTALDADHGLVVVDVDGNGDDEVVSVLGLAHGRLWDLSSGTLRAVQDV